MSRDEYRELFEVPAPDLSHLDDTDPSFDFSVQFYLNLDEDGDETQEFVVPDFSDAELLSDNDDTQQFSILRHAETIADDGKGLHSREYQLDTGDQDSYFYVLLAEAEDIRINNIKDSDIFDGISYRIALLGEHIEFNQSILLRLLRTRESDLHRFIAKYGTQPFDYDQKVALVALRRLVLFAFRKFRYVILDEFYCEK